MLSTLAQAASGLQSGFDRLHRAADRVARSGVPEPGDVVDLMRARHEVSAGAAVVRTSDDMIGTLLDVLA
jgi:hypothetical protein